MGSLGSPFFRVEHVRVRPRASFFVNQGVRSSPECFLCGDRVLFGRGCVRVRWQRHFSPDRQTRQSQEFSCASIRVTQQPFVWPGSTSSADIECQTRKKSCRCDDIIADHKNRDHKNQTGGTRETRAPTTTARTGGAGKPAAAYSRVNWVCAFLSFHFKPADAGTTRPRFRSISCGKRGRLAARPAERLPLMPR